MVSVDGAGFSCVRRCGLFAGRGLGHCAGLFVVVFGVDGVGFSCVRRCGHSCWPRTRSTRWPLLVSMVCSTSMFDDVGVTAGRGVGHRASCPRPLPWRYPSGFAGVSFATVMGLVVGWSERCLLVVAVWPWWVSMELGIRVFDDVGGAAVRGVGRGEGRRWCRWCGLSACSSVFEGVGGCAGRRLGRLVACWWTTFVVLGWAFGCSRLWAGVLAVV